MSRPYRDQSTGVWNGLPEVETKTEILEIEIFDNAGNGYPANLEIEVNDFEITVINVFKSLGARFIRFQNIREDINNAIRNSGYKSQEIIYN